MYVLISISLVRKNILYAQVERSHICFINGCKEQGSLFSGMLSWSKNIYFWNLVFSPFLVCPRRSLVGAHSSVHLPRVDIFLLTIRE